MTGRFLLAVLLTLSLAGKILGQVSTSGTATISISNSISYSTSYSTSYSNSYSTSYSNSYSNSYSTSPPVPAAPINLTNHFPTCALRPDNTNHIYYLCLAWSDPTGGSVSWLVTYTPAGGAPVTVTALFPYIYLPGLTPATAYAISIVGVNAAGRQSLPLTGSYTTDPTDAKTAYKTKDLQNLSCQNAISNTTYRRVVNCQWGTPAVAPSRVDIKGRCIATGARNKIVHKSLKGTATTVGLPINRASYTCYIEIFGVYLNHKANDGHGHKFVVSCNWSSLTRTGTCTNIR